MFKKKLITGFLTLSGFCMLCTGCGQKNQAATGGNAISSTPSPAATDTPAPTPTNTPTPSPTPVPDNVWEYKIVQNGYYNAAATWDENGVMTAYPEAVEGEYIYYNDCDEYYNNFVSETNVFNDAMISLDFDIAHSCDNSVKITGRESTTNGFAGFALRFNEENAIPLTNVNNASYTLGFWVYFQDDFNNGIEDEFTFCIWTNTDENLSPEKTCQTTEPGEDASDEEKDLYKRIKAEYDYSAKQGFSALMKVTVQKETWTYVEVPFNICLSEKSEVTEPMIVIATLGESNSYNITYYNPFYLDDITLTYDGIITKPEEEITDAPSE
ncbi:MAG: hypothetical protein ACI39R_04445 [Lachnospiraceae bacterium]